MRPATTETAAYGPGGNCFPGRISAFLITLLLCRLLLTTPLIHAEPLDPHDPSAEQETFQILPGFEVNLFASEPMLANPVHMTWDPRGRLWVACSWAYPQVKPGQEPNDKIIILEDTDGDGRADKSTVFADGLLVPTGFELGDGGVYVANAPDLLFFKDTDGDDKADVREVVLSGFGTEDNHHAISAWRWGPGGWLYFQEGTFLHAQVETPHGLTRLENGGVFQFHPRTLRLKVFADFRASNPWGHMFNRWGQSILIDNPQLYFMAPLTANSRAKLPYSSFFRASTKHSGGDFVSGRHLPEQFRNELWTNAYKTHGIDRYRIEIDGSGISAKELDPLIVSTSVNFRPVDLKTGPDGAIYIADWYNPLIGHMQHSFRDPRRDHTHGRIWRVSYKGRAPLAPPKLLGVPAKELAAHLQAPEDWTRNQVRRVLYDMDAAEAKQGLADFVESLSGRGEAAERSRLEALWSYQTIGVVERRLLETVLSSQDGRARAAAVRVIRYWAGKLDDPLALLAKAIQDEHWLVRLEAILSLSFLEDPEAMVIAVRALDRPRNRHIDHALQLTADALRRHWTPLYEAGNLEFDNADQESFALSTAQSSSAAVKPLMSLLNSGQIDSKRLEALFQPLVESGKAKDLEAVLDRISAIGGSGYSAGTVSMLLRGIEKAVRGRNLELKPEQRFYQRYFGHADAEVRIAAMGLAAALKVESFAAPILRIARGGSEPMNVRAAAAVALSELGKRGELVSLTAAANPLGTRYAGVIGLAAHDVADAAPRAAEVLSARPGKSDPAPLAAAFLERSGGADALARALEKRPPHANAAKAIMAHLNRTGQQHAGLAKVLSSVAPAAPLDQQLLAEEMSKLIADIGAQGDPARGEAIYRRPELACMNCHSIAAAGPSLGPDLAAIGSSSPMDYLVDANLQPSKGIKDQFANVRVTTKDGRVHNGILAYEDEQQVILNDATQRGKQTAIQAADIEDLQAMPSLMPAGLVNHLESRQEFLDLIRFLSELGKPGPYASRSRPVIRRWRVGGGDATEAAQLDPARYRDDSKWQPAYSLVSGLLPASEFHPTPDRIALLRAHVEVTTPGKVHLNLNSAAAITLWVDDQAVELGAGNVIELTTGRRALTFVVDKRARGNLGLRCELEETATGSARFQVVGGP